MTGKDPKDMTASELLRWAANGDDDEHGNHIAVHKLVSALSGMAYEETGFDRDRRNILALADKIDDEIEAARRDAVKESKKPMWWFRSAIRQGGDWPAPHDGEKFREYLKRCFIPRPRYEDGEPVDESDFGEDACLTVFGNGDWKIGNRYGGVIEMGSCRMRAQRPAAPDTQERIDGDSQKTADAYWGCIDVSCEDCPAKIDDKRPWERCYANNCVQAQMLDLLRRQRRLDEVSK